MNWKNILKSQEINEVPLMHWDAGEIGTAEVSWTAKENAEGLIEPQNLSILMVSHKAPEINYETIRQSPNDDFIHIHVDYDLHEEKGEGPIQARSAELWEESETYPKGMILVTFW